LRNFFAGTPARGIVSDFQKSIHWNATKPLYRWNSEMTTASTTLLVPLRIARTSDLGPAVRARRRQQSLRIDDAASLSGVSVDLLSRLENGKGSVRLDKLLTVLDGLGLTMAVSNFGGISGAHVNPAVTADLW